VALAKNAGFDPGAAIPFWNRPARESGMVDKAAVDLRFFSEHPPIKERIGRIQEVIASG